MTRLERTLARIVDLIEDARTQRDALALSALLQRKDAICAALSTSEHRWHQPAPRAAGSGVQHKAGDEATPLVA